MSVLSNCGFDARLGRLSFGPCLSRATPRTASPANDPSSVARRTVAHQIAALADTFAAVGRTVSDGAVPNDGLLTLSDLAEDARDGTIPKDCIASGTGDGKVWKFYRDKIDAWINAGRPGVRGKGKKG